MTIDGFVAGPNGEQDWITGQWDDELKKYVNDIIADGSATFVSNLIEEDQIDGCHMFINPVAIRYKTHLPEVEKTASLN